jgi:predicted HTH transcriptional regulator
MLARKDGTMLPKECELWDYKRVFEDAKDANLKTLKAIVSFHNTYGGYIVYGVSEVEKDTSFVLCGIASSPHGV